MAGSQIATATRSFGGTMVRDHVLLGELVADRSHSVVYLCCRADLIRCTLSTCVRMLSVDDTHEDDRDL